MPFLILSQFLMIRAAATPIGPSRIGSSSGQFLLIQLNAELTASLIFAHAFPAAA